MSITVIEVENLAKQYRLGQVGRRSLSHDINRWWHQLRGKENPYLKIGHENDRAKKAESEYVWALQDINFQVREGEVLGIIGRNGAGKSTLLKILSKVTAPTKGQVKIKGRIASLLEVGTGFHQDLSGRENIFLNGAILGMTKKEINARFDEIVDFSGIERYIDTPVKRYSSGMYVRLAFAVAAHLEPEILIIDEVLAVGDAEFQKKCLGKMKDVSEKDGRTVLFVSHNMDAVARLCKKCIYLKNGFINYMSSTEDVITSYLLEEKGLYSEVRYTKENAPGNNVVKLLSAEIIDERKKVKTNFLSTENIDIRIMFEVFVKTEDLVCGFNLYNQKDIHLFTSHDTTNYPKQYQPGIYETIVSIPRNLLANGSYYCGIAAMSYKPFLVHFHDVNKVFFNITDSNDSIRNQYVGVLPGIIRPNLNWKKVSHYE